MARVYSWKLPDGRYAYLDASGNYIRDSRISDVSELQAIGDNVRKMTPSEYQRTFTNMKSLVESSGYALKDWTYYFDVVGDAGTIFVSGRDGSGSIGTPGGGTSGGGTVSNPYEEMDKLKNQIDAMLKNMEETIKKNTEAAVNKSVSELNKDIADAMEELGNIRDRLDKNIGDTDSAMNDLRDWLEKIENGSGDEEGGSTSSEELNQILREFPFIKEWYEANKDADFSKTLTDVDDLKERVGMVGISIDALSGSVSTFGAHINTISGTVCTTERSMIAIEGKIKDMVTYTNLKESAETIVLREMNALSGTIKDEILKESALDGETVQVLRQMSQEGYIEDKVARMTDDETTVLYQKFDAVNASINKVIDNADSAMSASTRIQEEWRAKEGEITKALTSVDEAMSAVTDIRQEWSKNSGIVQTVGKFLQKEDGTYETDMMSYMNQTVSGITMGVIDKELSGPKIFAMMIDSDDEDGKSSVAGMVAEKILLSGDTFVTNLIAERGTIAGVDFTNGNLTYRDTSGNINYQLASDGSIYARKGKIEGDFEIGETVTVSKLITKPQVGSAKIEAYGSTINAYGTSGKRNIEFGVDTNTGYAVLKFYDNDGNLLYDLGPQGIRLFKGFTEDNFIYIARQNESWNNAYLYKVANSIDTFFSTYLNNAHLITGNTASDRFYSLLENLAQGETPYNSTGTTLYRFTAAREDGQITTGSLATTIETARANDGLLFTGKTLSSKANGVYWNAQTNFLMPCYGSREDYNSVDALSTDSDAGYDGQNVTVSNADGRGIGMISPLPPYYTQYSSYYSSMSNVQMAYEESVTGTIGSTTYAYNDGGEGLSGGKIDWRAHTGGTVVFPISSLRFLYVKNGVVTPIRFFYHSPAKR